MIETLLPLKVPPGIVQNGTGSAAAGRWADGNLVRFREGTVGPVGGWAQMRDSNGAALAPIAGKVRAMAAWSLGSGEPVLGFGSTTKLMLLGGGTLRDVTPVGLTAGREDGAFGSALGSYGNGVYGSSNYGTGAQIATFQPADTWQLDTFGNFLVGVLTGDGRVWVWEGNYANAAVQAPNSPIGCRGLVVTAERFLVALGAGGNNRQVQWASQGGYTVWGAATGNTAGRFELSTTGRLMAGRRARGQTLLFTDSDLHAMTYIGGQFIYRFDQVGQNCGLIAPNAVAMVDGTAYWMGTDGFFSFDGYVRPIACEVSDYVFGRMTREQRAKVVAVSKSSFGEVWWFFPADGAKENSRYVVYNYREGHWTVGALARTAGSDVGALQRPVLVAPDGTIFEHELATNHGGAVPFLETGPIELGAGDHVMKLQRLVPDERTLGDVQVSLKTAMHPTGPETTHGPFPVGAPTNLRVTARQVRLRLTQRAPGAWRVGTMKLGMRIGGRR